MAPVSRRLLSQESWDSLFDFLDPARRERRGASRDAQAESRLLEITRKLESFFASRGCREAGDLAVETVLRVAAKASTLDNVEPRERIAYFYGVARNVFHEWVRDDRRELARLQTAAQDPTIAAAPAPSTDQEIQHRCLDRCMERLSRSGRRLILNYYGGERTAKIIAHRQLAEQFGKSLNALRIEVHRIRNTLRQCVLECVQSGNVEPA